MAGVHDTLRGDGLARAQRAPDGLEGDPQKLNRERQRFDDPPPPYKSDRSGTMTRSTSPNPTSEEQRRRQERRVQLGREREASFPRDQFSAQRSEEKNRILKTYTDGTCRLHVGDNYYEIAYENVKKRWVEQGIWNNKWNKFASGRWKHEEPIELESETDSEAVTFPPLFSFFPEESQSKPRRPKSDDEKRRIAERRVVREREREASRPYHQFTYQTSKERERVQEESTSGEGTDMPTSIQGPTRMSRTPGSHEGFGTKDGLYCLECGGSMKSLLMMKPPTILLLQRIQLRTKVMKRKELHLWRMELLSETFFDVMSQIVQKAVSERSPSAPNSPRLRTAKEVLRFTIRLRKT